MYNAQVCNSNILFLAHFQTNDWLTAYVEGPLYIDHIGVGRFRILGGQGLEYWGGGQGGAQFPAGTCRRNDVDAT